MSILAWLVVAVIAFVVGLILTDKNFGAMGEFYCLITAVSLISAMVLGVLSFTYPATVSDPILLESDAMRGNNLTCVTYTKLDGTLDSQVLDTAVAYNSTNIIVEVKERKNSWGITISAEYSIKGE